MAVQRCARCGLVNPPSARKCDCGYVFASGHMDEPLRVRPARQAGDGAATRGLVAIIVGLISLAIAVAIVWISVARAKHHGGGTYYVATAPLAFGVAMVIRGVAIWIRGG